MFRDVILRMVSDDEESLSTETWGGSFLSRMWLQRHLSLGAGNQEHTANPGCSKCEIPLANFAVLAPLAPTAEGS